MSNEITPDEEQALDALLEEIHQGAAPPDLTQQILASFNSDGKSEDASVTSDSSAVIPVVQRVPARTHKRPKTVAVIAALVGLAAAGLLIVRLFDGTADKTETQTAQTDTPTEKVIAVTDNQPKKAPESEATKDKKRDFKAPRGISLVADDDPKPQSSGTDRQDETGSGRVAEDIMLVSKQHRQDFVAYWNAMGIDPTEFAGDSETAARIEQRLGLTVSKEGLNDVKTLRAELAAPKVAGKVARSWLNAMTEGGLERVGKDQRNGLVKELAESLSGKKPFDEVASGWVGGSSPNAGNWYSAMSAAGNESMLHRIGAITLNADLRCTRCHDSLIEGSGRQEEYWSLAALIRKGVRRDGKKLVVADTEKPKPLFYEVADGRQRAAEPVLPSGWTDGSKPIESLAGWADQLVGSRRLASGIVNSLWRLVHDRPLRASVVDAVSAPHHETLDALETRLVDHLIDSDFDVASTLALIITSPVSRLSVPESLLPENALVSTDAELQSARGLVHSFAANLPISKPLNFSGRIDLAMRSAATVRSIPGGNVVNAQARRMDKPGSNAKAKTPVDESAGFPVSASELPVQWLASVKGYENQVSHLSFLAVLVRVPKVVSKVASAMKDSPGISNELA